MLKTKHDWRIFVDFLHSTGDFCFDIRLVNFLQEINDTIKLKKTLKSIIFFFYVDVSNYSMYIHVKSGFNLAFKHSFEFRNLTKFKYSTETVCWRHSFKTPQQYFMKNERNKKCAYSQELLV